MKKGFIKAAVGALALTTMMGFACADGAQYSTGLTEEGTFTVDYQYDDDGEPTEDLQNVIVGLTNTAAFEWGNWDANENDFIVFTLIPGEGVDTTGLSFGFNGFTSSWKGWNGKWTEVDGTTTMAVRVAEIMEWNKIESIDNLGGINIQFGDGGYALGDEFSYKLQIKSVDSLYYSDNDYSFDVVIPEATDDDGEPTGEPNGTLFQLVDITWQDWGAYYYNPDDVFTLKVTPAEGIDVSEMNIGFNPFSKGWNGWSGAWSEAGTFEITTSVSQLASLSKQIVREGFGGIFVQIGGEGLQIGDEFHVELSITKAETADITLAPEEPIKVDATKNFTDGSKNYSDVKVGNYTVPLHFSKDLWNSWCPAVVKLTKDGVDTYYVFAGDQVGWDVTVAYAENEKGNLVSALVVPAKGDLEGYKGETEVANVGEWVVVKPGQSLDYTFDVSDAFTWSIQFMCPAWAEDDSQSVADADGTAKELPTAGEDGTAYSEVYVYVIGKVADSSAVEPAPNGDTPATDDKKADTKTDSTSPKTADGTSVAILSLVSILALAGVVVTKKNRA